MAISKEQPMRPALNDCVDFLNNNLEITIGGIENSITSLERRVGILENAKINVLSKSVTERNQPAHHLIVSVPLPENITINDVLVCLPTCDITSDTIEFDAIEIVPSTYTRWVNHRYNSATHSIEFHWYPSATTASVVQTYDFTYTANVVYIERSA